MGYLLGRMVARTASKAVFAVLLASLPALAAGKHADDGRQAKERAARKACLGGDYAKGVDLLSDLFIDTHDPTYVFNQGRCFEQNRRYEDAIARFDEYLHLPDAHLSADDRAAAEDRIANCKSKLPPDHAASPVTVPQGLIAAPSPGAQASPPGPSPEPTPVAPVVTEAAGPSPHGGSVLRVTGIVLGSAGVLVLTGAVLLNLKANSIVNDWQSKVSYTASQSDTRQTYKTLSWVGYGLGTACLATGAVLFGLGLKQRDRDSRVALVPYVGAGQTGAVLQGVF